LVKKILSAIVRIFLILLFAASLLIGVLHNGHVQSFLGRAGSTYLSRSLGVHVWIDKIRVTSYFNVLLENVYLEDERNNPLITAKSIQFKYNIFRPYISEIPINYLKIDSAFVNIVQYKNDSSLNIIKLFSGSSTADNHDSTEVIVKRKPLKLGLDYLDIQNTHFVYHIFEDGEDSVQGMNYEYLDIKDIYVSMKDVHLVDDSIWAYVKDIRGKDRCGVDLKHLEAQATVSSKNIILGDAFIQTNRSKASFNLAFYYDSWSAYLDFIDKVRMEADIRPSKINMEDIAYFASPMFGMDNVVRIQGNVKGPVRNLKGRHLHLSYGAATAFNGNAQMSGLPNIYETFINLKVKDFSTSLSDLEHFNLPGGQKMDMIPDVLNRLGNIRLKGRFAGFYNDFVSTSDIYTEIGKLKTDIQFTNHEEKDEISYIGKFDAHNFDVGKFTGLESQFGNINFNLDVQGKGLDLASLDTKVSGQINNLEYKKNPLNTIFIDALVQENRFNGELSISDSLIHATFLGEIDFDSIHPAFYFKAGFDDLKIAKLGLMDVDSSASISSRVHMNFTGLDMDAFLGSIRIDSTKLLYKDEVYSLDSLHIFSSKLNNAGGKQLAISSDVINGSIIGEYEIQDFSDDMLLMTHEFIHQIDLPATEEKNVFDQDFNFNFTLANTNKITSLLMPALQVNDSIFVNGAWKEKSQKMQFHLHTNSFDWNNMKIISPNLDYKADSQAMITNLSCNELVFKEASKRDSLRLGLDNLGVNFVLGEDSLGFAVEWNNRPASNYLGDIVGYVKFEQEQGFNLNFQHTHMLINDSVWDIAQNSRFLVDSNNYIFDSLKFYSQNQSVLINGELSYQTDKFLDIDFKNFNISVFDILTHASGINLDGFLTGQVQLIDVFNRINFLADLQMNQVRLNGESLGTAEIKSTWNTDQSVFVNVNLEKQGNKGIYKPLYLEGFYYPQKIDNQIDMDLSVHHLAINFLSPFLHDYVSDIDGRATGDIQISGSLKKPNLSGSIDLARTQFRIEYLNTLYSLSGTLSLDNNSLGFNQVTIYDTVGNKAVLEGGLVHHRLRDFGVDLKVHPDNFIGLYTRKGMNELFYGSAVLSGDIEIKGPFDNVFLNIDAVSKKGTDIHIPINTTLGVSENNFIVFNNASDTLKDEEQRQYKPQLSSFSLNMDLSVTPDAKVQIFLPSDLGEINAEGSGDLNLSLSRTGNFRMSGDYRVSKGLFFFKIKNLFNRKFTLKEGGTISWTGDPYSGTLGMRAKYQLKTSLTSLGLEQDSSYRNRVPVDCLIGLTGPIMNPNMKFSFEFPNATEEVKQYVFTKIDTTNSSEMSQQMLSLLVLNSFSFNSSNGSNSLASNMGGSSIQIVANQLSNWLSQISKDVDIGINYRPGSDLTNEEVEVALSTQLFDERVSIDGNFGYQNLENNPTSNTTNIVGDINVEVKITKDGRLRLKAFDRTNTVDLLDNTSPYTQGVGIFYRKEFNTLKELFQSKKRKEKQRQKAMEKEQDKAFKNEDKTSKSVKKSEK